MENTTGMPHLQNFILHVKTATCFGYTYVAIIRADIESRIRKTILHSFSYSWFYIQPRDGYICIAETCSCLYV